MQLPPDFVITVEARREEHIGVIRLHYVGNRSAVGITKHPWYIHDERQRVSSSGKVSVILPDDVVDSTRGSQPRIQRLITGVPVPTFHFRSAWRL